MYVCMNVCMYVWLYAVMGKSLQSVEDRKRLGGKRCDRFLDLDNKNTNGNANDDLTYLISDPSM